MSDELTRIDALTSGLRGGDDTALADLVALFRDRLKTIVRFRLDHRLAARVSDSDVIQDIYISARQRLDHFRDRPDMPVFVWLRLLVQQQLADLHRHHFKAEKRDVRREISIDQPAISPHTSLAMANHLVGDVTSPSRAISRMEQVARLEEALNGMEPLDREVIALRHFEELTNNEVAAVLQIGVQAASKRYVRAIKRMREILQQIPGFE